MWSHLRIKPLSGMQSTHIKKYIRFNSEHGIGAVITAIKGKNLADKIPKHIEYLYVPVVDHESCNISVFFKDSFEFIEEERKRTNVLVHCMAGVSRSVTLVIAYIMQKSGAPFSTAYEYVKSKRPIVNRFSLCRFIRMSPLWSNCSNIKKDSSKLVIQARLKKFKVKLEMDSSNVPYNYQMWVQKMTIWQNSKTQVNLGPKPVAFIACIWVKQSPNIHRDQKQEANGAKNRITVEKLAHMTESWDRT